MSINIPTLFVESFSTNLALLLQQKGSTLRGALTEGTYVGSQASPVDQIAAVEAQPVTTRFAPMGRVDAKLDRRWVFPSDFDLPQMIDSFDKLRLLVDPESAYVTNAVYGIGRKIDDVILTAFFAAANTGVNGATSTTFPSTQVVGVNTGGTNSNMNVAKIRAGKKLLLQNFVDLDNDPIYCAISANENDALLNEIQVINTQYAGAFTPSVVNGQIKSVLGVNFIHCERVINFNATDDQSGTSTPIPMWAKSGMHLGMWGGLVTDVSQRKDIQGLPFQAYVKATVGATRLEEKKTIKIWSH